MSSKGKKMSKAKKRRERKKRAQQRQAEELKKQQEAAKKQQQEAARKAQQQPQAARATNQPPRRPKSTAFPKKVAPKKYKQNSTKGEVKEPDTVTENFAPAYSTTEDTRIDLFFNGLVRGADANSSSLYNFLRDSWAYSPRDTIALLLHARDCRGGKGERSVVISAFLWMRHFFPKTYALNLQNLLDVGCYRDLLQLASKVYKLRQREPEKYAYDGADDETLELKLFVDALHEDESKLDDCKEEEGPKKVSISLAAKWAPSEKGQYDQIENGKLSKALRKMLFPDQHDDAAKYRKLIARLRKHLKVVERFMCDKTWEKIAFGTVPSRAHNIYRKAFQKHQAERYAKYIEDVKSGKEKINTTGLQPHQLVSPLLKSRKPDDTLETQWATLVKKLKDKGSIPNAVAVVDVSGSMSGTPMEVAIALGLVLALLSEGSWHRRVITFHENPTWFPVTGRSLLEMVTQISRAPWGGSTNFQKVYELVLNRAMKEGGEMPQMIFVFSDMQFNQACGYGRAGLTNFDDMKRLYKKNGFSMPQLVFWNLRGTMSFPTQEDENVALVSGFSSDLMDLFLNGGELSAVAILELAIDPYRKKVKLDLEEIHPEGQTGEDGD